MFLMIHIQILFSVAYTILMFSIITSIDTLKIQYRYSVLYYIA